MLAMQAQPKPLPEATTSTEPTTPAQQPQVQPSVAQAAAAPPIEAAAATAAASSAAPPAAKPVVVLLDVVLEAPVLLMPGNAL